MTTDMPNTTLIQTNIRSMDNPDGYFAVTLENAYYRIRILYMQKDYQSHKQNNDFDPLDIHLLITPLKSNAPQIICVLTSEDKTRAIALDPGCDGCLIFEERIDGYIENMKAAKLTIGQLKEAIRKYFGEDMV